MDEQTLQKVKDKFNALPDSVKEAIMSSHYQDALLAISRKYQLNYEQMGILEQETTLVMLGLTPMDSFEEELKKELGIESLRTSQIVKDIGDQVFLPIRDLLKLMYTPKGEAPSTDDEQEAPSETEGYRELFLEKDARDKVAMLTPYFNKANPTPPPPIKLVDTPPAPKPEALETETTKLDKEVLSSAGINIVRKDNVQPAPVPTSKETLEKREDILSEVEHPEQIRVTPPNVSTPPVKPVSPPAQPAMQTAQSVPPTFAPPAPRAQAPVAPVPPPSVPASSPAQKTDPYRMPIE